MPPVTPLAPLAPTRSATRPDRLATAADDDDGDGATPAPAATDADRPLDRPWHALGADDALARLDAGPEGLSADAAARRLAVAGPNILPRGRGDTPLALLMRQVNNPLIYVLIASSAVALAMGKVLDGLVVLGVVVVNTIIGFLQEYRAGKAIEALSAMVPESATVLRGGERVSVPAADLVPGDVVALQSGDKVPADVRLLGGRDLRVDEAALTGESVPVEKALAVLPPDAPLGDRRNMAYSGTLVTYGAGTGVVVATGAATELGRVSALLEQAADLQTPLTRQMQTVGKWLTIAILVVSAVLMAIGLARGYPLADALLAGIALAVAAIPEGLPAIITIALAIGVRRMARRHAIIRKLPAVETLGSTTVICSDKTGTLTRNEMTVQALWTAGGAAYRVAGVGYAPDGAITPEHAGNHNGGGNGNGAMTKLMSNDVHELLLAGVLCNDAAVARRGDGEGAGAWHVAGDPTEGALVVAAAKAGIDAAAARQRCRRIDAIPFESERQFMATLHETPDAGATAARTIYVKGAPEVVLARCAGADVDAAHAEMDRLAAQGMRVLAFAARPVPADHARLDEQDVAGGLALLGLQGMIDPPRPEAVAAVAACHRAGITVKMITGDHRRTAEAIGRELGLAPDGARAVTGVELAAMDDAALAAAAAGGNVFARVAPEHKLRLVRALQAQGHVVAMTGDGVNDAPALKQADIGVAMGITGTAVSKEAADVVLADDNFASIAAAVEEGRRVYDNLVKALAFVLPTNLGLALILMAAVTAFPTVNGVPLLPMEPVQILWINLVATVALALPLAFEAREPDVMRRPPRRPDAPVLGAFVLIRTALVGLLMAGGALGLFLYEYHLELPRVGHALALAEAQTMAVTTVILFQVFYLLNCRSLRDSILAIGLLSNPKVYAGIAALLVLQVGFVYAAPLNAVFGSAPLNADALTKSLAVAAVVLPVISLEKWLHARRRRGATAGRDIPRVD